MSDDTRSIERTLVIDADPDTVWRALTEAGELQNWFPTRARVESPGVGGRIDLLWDEVGVGCHCRIMRWEPGRHLLMSWRDEPDGEHPLPVDIRLEARDGCTVLHLVHSGFLSDASWDDEFESHGRGWSFELRSLKYYVERFRGCSRQMVGRRLKIRGDVRTAWEGIVSEAGLFRISGAAALKEGAEFMLDLPDGSSTAARVFSTFSDAEFAVVADVLQGGIVRLELETFLDQPEIFVWIISWRLAEYQLERMLESWWPELVRAATGPD